MVNPGNPDGIKGGAWIMDADGRNGRWIGEGWYTRWSPLGGEICVYAHFTNPPSLAIYDLKTDQSRTIFGGDISVIFGGANWSRDGQRLATLIRRNGEQQLVTIAASGNLETLQVVYRETEENRVLVGPPVISPDGKEILFIRQELEHEDAGSRQWMNTYLYLVSSDGQGAPQLLEGAKLGKINRSMDWSPDGKRILFSSER
jgi:Tol biopolymer transport system component